MSDRRRFLPRIVPVLSSSRRPVVLSLAALSVTGVALLILINMLAGISGDPAPDRVPRPAPAPALAAPSPCAELEARSESVRDLLSRGQLTAALSSANEGLIRPVAPGCGEAHLDLARLWYTGDLDDLLATSVDDETLSSQTPVRWTLIERRADQLGVPGSERRPAMTLAQSAYDRGLWQLADTAFRDAWSIGQIGVGGVEFRHALLRNWGHRRALRNTPAARAQGLELLATAHAVAQRYDLQTDVACTDMRALGVVDCSKTKPDLDEPTLAAARSAVAP